MKTKKVQDVVETVQFSNSEKVFGASLLFKFKVWTVVDYSMLNIHVLNNNRAMDDQNVPRKYSAVWITNWTHMNMWNVFEDTTI